MSSKKDLVEAHAFSRRRLVTAFVSGAPGGREVEPTRPGRILVGGAALSVLLLAGAAISGFLLGRPDSEWLAEGSFIISKDTGEQYVVLNGGEDVGDAVIQRVPNYISAQLLLGDSELTPHTVKDEYIREVQLGPDLGIESAPAGLPAPEGLIDSGWTACTAEGTGVRLAVQREPEVAALPDGAFLVTTGAGLWLVAAGAGTDRSGTAYRYQILAGNTEASTLVNRLGFSGRDDVVRVSEGWLNLLPQGPAIQTRAFGVSDDGGRITYEVGADLTGRAVGDLVRSPAGRYYLLGDAGPQELQTPFAIAAYVALGNQPVDVDLDLSSDFRAAEYPSGWPSAVPEAMTAGDLCLVLESGEGQPARVSLATSPGGAADPEGIGRGQHVTDVDPAGGAYVRAGSSAISGDEAPDDLGGTPYVVDAKGFKYALVGPEVAGYLGYGTSTAPLVPPAWLDYFPDGVELSTNSARRVPEDAPPEEGSEEAS